MLKLSKGVNTIRPLRYCAAVALLGLALLLGAYVRPTPAPPPSADRPTTGNSAIAAPSGVNPKSAIQNPKSEITVGRSLKNDVSPPLRDIPPILPLVASGLRIRESEAQEGREQSSDLGEQGKDPVVQTWFGPLAMPTPIRNFEGINVNNGQAVPPDANGDVGPNH